MAIDQTLLLQAASLYREKDNQEYYPGSRLAKIPKRRIYISHSMESFRMVEGFIVLLQKAGIDAFFDWESGAFTDEFRNGAMRDLKFRIARSEVYIFLATENSIRSETCLKSLDFASIINRKVYIAQTTAGTKEFGFSPPHKFDLLTVERENSRSQRFGVKILEKQRQNLWLPITNVSQL